MTRFLCPFLITDTKQIPDKLIRKYNLGLEAICFESELLSDFTLIAEQVKKVNSLYPGRLTSFHFPTENADYLRNPKTRKQLFELIELCVKHGINKIVIHSNYFEQLAEFNFTKLPAAREKFIHLFKKIDAKLAGTGLTLLIENMPIIGNKGDDFDSVFVFPKDFNAFKKFKNVKINWDLGHWAFTMAMVEQIKELSPIAIGVKAEFFDFKSILAQIEHCHLSSFKGLAFPSTGGICSEGVPPHLGDYKASDIETAVRMISAAKPNILISLEIAEQDYYNRKNLSTTLGWLRSKGLI